MIQTTKKQPQIRHQSLEVPDFHKFLLALWDVVLFQSDK